MKIHNVREDNNAATQNNAFRAWKRGNHDGASVIMQEVDSLVASVSPTYDDKGEQTGSEAFVFVNRLHPRSMI